MKWYRVDFVGIVESDYICAESNESAICKAFKHLQRRMYCRLSRLMTTRSVSLRLQ